MKKLLLLLMSIVMIFTLSGCESSEKVISIYGVVSKNEIKEMKYEYDKNLNISKLVNALSFWSGANFYLETSEPSDNVLYVNFLGNSDFVKGLGNVKSKNFTFKDDNELRLFMLNSLAYTIRKNIKEYDIYFTANGKSINEYLSIDDIDFTKAYNTIENELVVY